MRSPLIPFRKETLPNGLTVIAKQVTSTPIAAVYLWVRAGSVCEPPEIGGISHFLEHMFFKGTERRGVGVMDREIKGLGGYNNAFTGMEYTAYYAVVPSAHMAGAVELLTDAMMNSTFDPEEIERERKVIREEIRRSEDSPRSKLSRIFLEAMFGDAPYGRPVLGSEASLERIGRDTFLAYRGDFYAPDQVTAVVVGDVRETWAVETVWAATEGWQRGGLARLKWPDPTSVRPLDPAEREVEKDVNLGYWSLGFPGPGRGEMAKVHALDVATTVLGSGRSSRLHRRLVEEMKVASSAGAWVWPLAHAGILGLDAEFAPENRGAVQEAALEEVVRMGREPVPAGELAKAKRMILSGFAYGNETNANIASTLGRYHTLSTVEDAVGYVDAIRSVSGEDVLRAMGEYGRPEARTVACVRPKDQGALTTVANGESNRSYGSP